MARYVCKTFVHVADPHPQSPAMLAAMRHFYQYEMGYVPRWQGRLNTRNDILLSLYKSDVPLICAYCQRNDLQPFAPSNSNRLLTFDHVIPRSRGGQDRIENYAICCHKCNQAKADKELPDNVRESIITVWQLLYADVKTRKEIAMAQYELGARRAKARAELKSAKYKEHQKNRKERLETNDWHLWDILCAT